MKDFYADIYSDGSSTFLRLIAKGTDKVLQELPIINARAEHRNYIISTWVRSFETMARRMVSSCGASLVHLDPESFRAGESRLAESHWTDSKVIVSPEDGYTIHGWFAIGPSSSDSNDVPCNNGILRHCYVPPDLRNHGICRVVVEHFLGKTYKVSKPWPSTPKGHYVVWNPYV